MTRVKLSRVRNCWVVLDSGGFSGVSLVSGGFRWFLVGFLWFLVGFIGFWLVSMGFIGFWLVSDWFLIKLTRVRNFAECTNADMRAWAIPAPRLGSRPRAA